MASDGTAIPTAIPHLIDHVRLQYITANNTRRCLTTEIEDGGHQTGSSNNLYTVIDGRKYRGKSWNRGATSQR